MMQPSRLGIPPPMPGGFQPGGLGQNLAVPNPDAFSGGMSNTKKKKKDF